jgi:RHS repeat-associated protein
MMGSIGCRALSETAGTTYYSYDPCSNETGVTLPNGATVVRGFDHAGNLTSITNSSVISGVTTTLTSYSYVLDADSRRTSCTEYSGDVVSWGYDWGGRLTSESRTGSSAYSTAYTLDGEGRRTSQAVTVGGSTATTSFSLNADDELTSTSSSTGGFTNSYSYNDNGEQIGRTLSGTTYSQDFDYDGQMTSTTGASTTSFAYDALGRRVSRTAGGTTTNFQYMGDSVLLEKQGSTTTSTYTYGNALIRKDGETPLYDGLGTARAETNSSQAVTFTQIPDAFGNTVATTGSTASSYQFAATSGYRTDGDAGLMKVGARYYDPQVGSFTTRDTYLDQKPYLYCEHDPVNGVDPSGHDINWGDLISELFGGGAGGAIGGMLGGGTAGGEVGTVAGPVGTAVGAGIGAVIGGLGGLGVYRGVGWAIHAIPRGIRWSIKWIKYQAEHPVPVYEDKSFPF